MRMTPREIARWMEGYNVRFAMDMRLHGIKADIPRFDVTARRGAVNVDPDALQKVRERVHARDAERAERLGIPVR